MPLNIESYAEPEVVVAAVVVAAAASPPVRRTLRRGLVYGLAGLLMAGDKVTGATTAVACGVKRAAKTVTGKAAPAAAVAPAPG